MTKYELIAIIFSSVSLLFSFLVYLDQLQTNGLRVIKWIYKVLTLPLLVKISKKYRRKKFVDDFIDYCEKPYS